MRPERWCEHNHRRDLTANAQFRIQKTGLSKLKHQDTTTNSGTNELWRRRKCLQSSSCPEKTGMWTDRSAQVPLFSSNLGRNADNSGLSPETCPHSNRDIHRSRSFSRPQTALQCNLQAKVSTFPSWLGVSVHQNEDTLARSQESILKYSVSLRSFLPRLCARRSAPPCSPSCL